LCANNVKQQPDSCQYHYITIQYSTTGNTSKSLENNIVNNTLAADIWGIHRIFTYQFPHCGHYHYRRHHRYCLRKQDQNLHPQVHRLRHL
jgi:hypothetical protein